ncbi:MAG TPA: putative S-layer protein [Candidatus Nanoarchaeia archaeon]|nr:putative S-layer protein [Candidatus Nanoarchaeia archaeon]
MNFTKLASLFAFVAFAVISLTLVSAQTLTFNPTSINQNIIAGQSTPISFSLINSGSSTSSLTWSVSIPSGTISLPNTNSIGSGQTIQVSSNIFIPLGLSGTISGFINISGNNGSVVTQAILPITLTIVQPSSNLTITAPSTPISFGQNATLTVINTGNTALSIRMTETTSPLLGVVFSPQSFSLSASQSQVVQSVLTSLGNIKFGLNTVSVRAEATNQNAATTYQIKKTFCSSGETLNGNLSISNIDWTNDGQGDDNSWELLDEIEVEVEVANNNDRDDVDVIIELGLFDSSGKNVADDLIFLENSDGDSEEIEININDDDEETVTWNFKVPADFDKGNYKLAIKAYDDDNGESRDCRDSSSDLDNNFFQSINIEETSDEGRFVIVDSIEMDSQVTCGQTVTGQFTVFNVGEEDQDRVNIIIRNSKLGISESREITSDLDRGDDETLDFSITVPANAVNGNYVLEFITQYDYRNGVYREDSEDSFDAFFEVLGCSQNLVGPSTGLTNIAIDAELGSDAAPGEELIIIATISNTGTEDATYSISARGYSSWADLKEISESTISVDAKESKEVRFTLIVNEDATGANSFDIQVARDGKVQIQEVEIELSSKKNIFEFGNSLIWIVGAVNLILIILIIIVAVRMSRR